MMRISRCVRVLASSIVGIIVSACAQTPATTAPSAPRSQTTHAAPAPSAAVGAPTSPVTPVKVTREAIRKANNVGLTVVLTKDGIQYCRDDALIGTRIRSVRCLTQIEFEMLVEQLELARIKMGNPACLSVALCDPENHNRGRSP